MASAKELRTSIEEALSIFRRIQTWSKAFSSILNDAKVNNEGLSAGWVWQDDLLTFFQRLDTLQESLREVEGHLHGYTFEDPSLSSQAVKALKLVAEPPKKTRSDYAMEVFEFFEDPRSEGDENIAYKVPRLQDWFRNFERWTTVCKQGLQGLLEEIGRQA